MKSRLRASKELGFAYNTVHKLFMLIRRNTYQQKTILSGEIEMDESYFGGRRKGKRERGTSNKTEVFGILERGGEGRGRGRCEGRDTFKRSDKGGEKRKSYIRYKSYDELVMYGFRNGRIDHSKRFADGKVYINGIEGFWSYAKRRLLKYHGTSLGLFPLYLKELEFRV